MLRRMFFACVLLCAGGAMAATAPYDERADAQAAIAAAVKTAQGANRKILLVFGANWCGDCVKLDAALTSGRTAELVNAAFVAVKVDVGNFDRNGDIARRYDVPLRKGIPTIAVLSGQGQVLYTTRAGELASARKLGDEGLYLFFSDLIETLGR
jgi:thioredoxin 1